MMLEKQGINDQTVIIDNKNDELEPCVVVISQIEIDKVRNQESMETLF